MVGETPIVEKELSVEERQRRFTRASHEYIRGEIDLEQLEQSEKANLPDYELAIRQLSSVRTGILDQIRRFLHQRHAEKETSNSHTP